MESNSFHGYINLYDEVVDIGGNKSLIFDIVLMLDMFLRYSFDKVLGFVNVLSKYTRYILVNIPFPSYNLCVWDIGKFCEYGKVIDYYTSNSERFVMIDTDECKVDEDVRLYVMTHKKFTKLYDGSKDRFRIPIDCGATLHEHIEGYLRDDVKDNISRFNPYLNEFTALYWVWKNTKSKYVGFEHYRRTFLSDIVPKKAVVTLSENEIVRFLDYEKYDFMVIKPCYAMPMTVGTMIRKSINEKVYDTYFERIRGRIMKISPEYLDAFDECFLECSSFYPCNMFITKWENFDEYCGWIFGILIDVVDVEDLERCDSYTKRVVAFFGERLLTVWLLTHSFRVKEMRYVMRESDESPIQFWR